MKETPEFPDIDTDIPPNAVRVIDSSSDEFPVLKAFQKYVDAEQSKARKRMLLLSIFFGVLLTIVIAIFLLILNNISGENQRLNDRLIEYVMKDRQAAVVVQPSTDNSLLIARIDAMQQKIEESSRKAAEESARAQAEREAAIRAEEARKAAEAAKPKGPTREEQEIERLRALLDSERKKAEAERERRHQEELEAYRRRYYPEYYAKKTASRPPADSETDIEIEQILNDLDNDEPIDYFQAQPSKIEPRKTTYSIPVEVNGSSKSWRIPE